MQNVNEVMKQLGVDVVVDQTATRAIVLRDGPLGREILDSPVGRYLGVRLVDDEGNTVAESPETFEATLEDAGVANAAKIVDRVAENPGRDGGAPMDREHWEATVKWLQRIAPGVVKTENAVVFPGGETVYRMEPKTEKENTNV